MIFAQAVPDTVSVVGWPEAVMAAVMLGWAIWAKISNSKKFAAQREEMLGHLSGAAPLTNQGLPERIITFQQLDAWLNAMAMKLPIGFNWDNPQVIELLKKHGLKPADSDPVL